MNKRLFKISLIRQGHYIRIEDLYKGGYVLIERNYFYDNLIDQVKHIFKENGIEIDGVFNTVDQSERYIATKNFILDIIIL